MPALYRKYRPQLFKEVIGQNHVKITLQNELSTGEVGHAFLFCGPRGLGKTTLARLFAKAINCERRKEGLPAEADRPAKVGESEPCNKCDSCLEIIGGRSVDVIEIDAASHTGVDNVRENIIENARFTPNKSKYKVFIIDEVHMLSTSAFNALLKTLEEPPAHAIFILCTTEIHKLPQTIVSRCQRFDLKKVASADLLRLLAEIIKAENKKVAEPVLKNIVAYSEGCVRDAESLLGKVLSLGDDVSEEQAELVLPRADFQAVIDFLNFIADSNSTAAIEHINRLVAEGVDLPAFMENLLEFLRQVLLVKVNGNLSGYGLELNEENEKAAEKLAGRYSYEKLLSTIDLFLAKKQEMKFASIEQLPLEMAAIELSENIERRKKDNDDFGGPSIGGIGPGAPKKNIEAPRRDVSVKMANNSVPEAKIEITSSILPPLTKGRTEEGSKSEQNENNGESHFNLDQVRENWQKIVAGMMEKNYTLSSVLKISEPMRVKGNILEIGVQSQFYKCRLDEAKNNQMICEAISGAIGANVAIKGVVSENLQPITFADEAVLAAPEAEPMPAPVAAPVSAPVPPPMTPMASKDVLQDVISMF